MGGICRDALQWFVHVYAGFLSTGSRPLDLSHSKCISKREVPPTG